MAEKGLAEEVMDGENFKTLFTKIKKGTGSNAQGTLLAWVGMPLLVSIYIWSNSTTLVVISGRVSFHF